MARPVQVAQVVSELMLMVVQEIFMVVVVVVASAMTASVPVAQVDLLDSPGHRQRLRRSANDGDFHDRRWRCGKCSCR